jgi:hypothetical protein
MIIDWSVECVFSRSACRKNARLDQIVTDLLAHEKPAGSTATTRPYETGKAQFDTSASNGCYPEDQMAERGRLSPPVVGADWHSLHLKGDCHGSDHRCLSGTRCFSRSDWRHESRRGRTLMGRFDQLKPDRGANQLSKYRPAIQVGV